MRKLFARWTQRPSLGNHLRSGLSEPDKRNNANADNGRSNRSMSLGIRVLYEPAVPADAVVE